MAVTISLKKAGETTGVTRDESNKGIIIGAKWKSSNDLDLHAFVEYKDGTVQHVYHWTKVDNKGNVSLDKDAGVGGHVAAGGNDETIRIKSLAEVKKLSLAINDYDGGRLKRTKPRIKIELNGKVVDVEMAEISGDGNWLTLVYIHEDEFGGHEIVNLTEFSNNKLSFSDIERKRNIASGIDKTVDAVETAGKSLLGKVKGFFGR